MGHWQCWFGESARVVHQNGWCLITPRLCLPLPAKATWLLPLWVQLCEAPQDLDVLLSKVAAAQRQDWHTWRQRFSNWGLWHYCLMGDGKPQLDLFANGAPFDPEKVCMPTVPLKLSRDVFFRRVANRVMIASARSPVEMRVHEPLIDISLNLLTHSRPLTAEPNQAALVSALVQMGFLVNVADADTSAWPFHELLFHQRRTLGDATGMPGQKNGPPDQVPPVFKPCRGSWISLPTPRHDTVRQPLSELMASRRSHRLFAEDHTLNHGQLSTWLALTYGMQSHVEKSYGYTTRPTPSGGAMHPLELYLLVHRVEGLATGVYRYVAREHGLEKVSDFDGLASSFLQQASQTMAAAHVPLLIVVTARIGRVQQAYAQMAYSLCQQDCGALWQSFYLVATALGLGGCVSGWSDDRCLSQLIGVEPEHEPMMGAFALGVPAGGEHCQ